ncbi:HMA2 domain-containing protein [Neobacillus niacini]|uniref:HMA2 domain-containing protein n=1 Tax=Neobacillus niacini TaxID=86668 RepID=UPI0021CAE454|nr:hypothetical protein [Neobacillus niacini]MCM3766432.1 hypothetical protein [Neobacillus niacini]
MDPKMYILHDIPGRLRLYIPMLSAYHEQEEIKMMFTSLRGVQDVRIQPIIQTMLIHYEADEISRNQLLKCVLLFFYSQPSLPFNYVMSKITPNVRGSFVRSLIAGGLLLLAYIQGTSFKQPTALVYGAVIATGYAVLSHGTQNKFRHPDIITGILSLASLGPANMLHGAMITWAVNVLELLHDMQSNKPVLSGMSSYRLV